MHAMQYEITLPAHYDMGIIRERVATRGHLLDAFPGLGLKAYLIRERGETSPVNQYAPLYLWSAPEGMNSFLWGPGFQGIVDDFGRPEVRHWTGLHYAEGAASEALPAPPSAAASGSRTPSGRPPRWRPRWRRAAGWPAPRAMPPPRWPSIRATGSCSTSPSGRTSRPARRATATRCCTCRRRSGTG